MQRWEYKVIDLVKETEKIQDKTATSERWIHASDLEDVLNTLGEQGWELVDVHFILDRRETIVIGFFKRPLKSNSS